MQDRIGAQYKQPEKPKKVFLRSPTKNLHRNFQDLKPIYDMIRYGKGKALAKRWEEQIGKVLLQRVAERKRIHFNEYLNDGGTVKYGELKLLNTILKKDYQDHIIRKHEDVIEYLDVKNQEILKKHDAVNKLIYDIEDIADTWDEAVVQIDDAVKKKMIKAGFSEDQYKDM